MGTSIKFFFFKIFTFFPFFTISDRFLGVKRGHLSFWCHFFGGKKVLLMKLPFTPLLIYDFSILYTNSGAFSVSVVTTFNDHFFKGKIFHENFKIISKNKKRFLVERCKRISTSFSKKVFKNSRGKM